MRPESAGSDGLKGRRGSLLHQHRKSAKLDLDPVRGFFEPKSSIGPLTITG